MANPADPAEPFAAPAPDGPAADRSGPAGPGKIGRRWGFLPALRTRNAGAKARVTHRVAVFVVAAAACGLLAWAGVWFTPFLAGVAAGVLSARWRRGVVLPVVTGAVVGWAFPIWVLALSGQPVGATARSIAALAGIPPYAGVAVVAVLLLAALQALCGAWLARGIVPAGKPRGGTGAPAIDSGLDGTT